MGGAVFPPCCLTWGQTMVEVMKIMATSFKRSHACTAALSAPDPAAGHHWPTPLLETPGYSRACLVHCGITAPFSWVLVYRTLVCRFCLCPPKICFPIPVCKFWWLCGGVNGNLLQEGLCHTQVCYTQSPCPQGRLLLTCTFILKHLKAGLAQEKVCFHSNPKERQYQRMFKLLHNCTHLNASKVMLKIKPGFSNMWTVNFLMFKLFLEKAEEPEIKLPTSAGSWKKQESSRKASISALLTMPKPLTLWITINCGKFWNRWENQTTWSASWEICMQVRKQQLELDMEQQTGSK